MQCQSCHSIDSKAEKNNMVLNVLLRQEKEKYHHLDHPKAVKKIPHSLDSIKYRRIILSCRF
jgi:hypothetical protein